jgi:hypothetical protein
MEYLLTISPSLGKMIRNMIKEVNERMNDGALTQSEP